VSADLRRAGMTRQDFAYDTEPVCRAVVAALGEVSPGHAHLPMLEARLGALLAQA
jgi:protein-disulfide isomerase-like protein with CxxC motif